MQEIAGTARSRVRLDCGRVGASQRPAPDDAVRFEPRGCRACRHAALAAASVVPAPAHEPLRTLGSAATALAGHAGCRDSRRTARESRCARRRQRSPGPEEASRSWSLSGAFRTVWLPRRRPPPTTVPIPPAFPVGDRSDSWVMHDGSAVARPPRGPAGTIRTLQRPPEQGRLGNRDVCVAVLALVFLPQPQGMSRVMDRCADAAATGVKKPDESLPAPASHSGSAETVSGSGWRCWQEADIVRSGRSLDPSDDSPGAPFVDRSPDALYPLSVKSRIDRVRDDAVGPEKLVFNWRKASSYGPRARRGLRRTLSSVLCGQLLDRAQDHVAPVDGQAIDGLVAHVPPAIGRAPRADEGGSRATGIGSALRRDRSLPGSRRCRSRRENERPSPHPEGCDPSPGEDRSAQALGCGSATSARIEP